MSNCFVCPLCRGTTYEPVIDLRDRMMRSTPATFRLVRCTGCTLMRLYPPPDEETLTAAYTADYAPHVRPGLSGMAKGVLEHRSVRLLRDYVGAPNRVLDVGCATGDLLLAIQRGGNARVRGVELDDGAAGVARARGLDVVTGDLASAGFAEGAFDTVLVSHTIEHVPDPVAFLREVRRVLSPGGHILLWLPNVDSLEARVLRRYWIGYDAPRHLTTFSTGTVGRALSATGFAVEDVRHEAVGLEWAWGLRLLLRDYVPVIEPLLRKLHAPLIVALSPLSLLSSRMRRSGRIRVIARTERT